MIRNKVNGKVYVGSSSVSIRGRWAAHRHDFRSGKHGNKILQRAWNKHGEGAFEFSVLCNCNPEWCLVMEQIHMRAKKCTNRSYGYNILPNAGSVLGRKMTPKQNAENSRRQKGRKVSPECLEAIRAERKARAKDPVKLRLLQELANAVLQSPEVREKCNEGIRRYWKNPNPEHVAKLDRWRKIPVAGSRKFNLGKLEKTPEHKQKLRDHLNKIRHMLSSPKVRAKMRASAKARRAREKAQTNG